MKFSVLILTKNEEKDLPGCLESLALCDDVHVFDSGSVDATKAIALQAGASFTQRVYNNNLPFGGDESAHRNWAIDHLPFKHQWVFTIDADERMTPDLIAEILALSEISDGVGAFRVQRRDFFLGKWLKHVQTTPYYIRLFRVGSLRYDRVINPITIVDGNVAELNSYLDHFPFSKGIGYWFERHNGYSTGEAKQIIANRVKGGEFSLLKAFFESDFNKRRYHQKELFYRLPLRPLFKFVILYFLKRGFLDGRAGFIYAILQTIYEFMIVLKTEELQAPALHLSKK